MSYPNGMPTRLADRPLLHPNLRLLAELVTGAGLNFKVVGRSTHCALEASSSLSFFSSPATFSALRARVAGLLCSFAYGLSPL
jgi:hypothetical protein